MNPDLSLQLAAFLTRTTDLLAELAERLRADDPGGAGDAAAALSTTCREVRDSAITGYLGDVRGLMWRPGPGPSYPGGPPLTRPPATPAGRGYPPLGTAARSRLEWATGPTVPNLTGHGPQGTRIGPAVAGSTG